MQLSLTKLAGFACVCTGALAAVVNDAAHAAVDQCTGGNGNAAHCAQVGGEVHTKVSNRGNGRRLAEGTGFSSDPQAQKSMKDSVASMAKTASEKVKIHMTKSKGRRLADQISDFITTHYSVLADNATHALNMAATLQSKGPAEVTAVINKQLAANNETAYDVSATQHTVTPAFYGCHDVKASDVNNSNDIIATCARNAIWAKETGLRTAALNYNNFANLTTKSGLGEFQCMLWYKHTNAVMANGTEGHGCMHPCTPQPLTLNFGALDPICNGDTAAVPATDASGDPSPVLQRLPRR